MHYIVRFKCHISSRLLLCLLSSEDNSSHTINHDFLRIDSQVILKRHIVCSITNEEWDNEYSVYVRNLRCSLIQGISSFPCHNLLMMLLTDVLCRDRTFASG